MNIHDITRFSNPELLWLLLLLPLMVAYYIYRQRQGGATMQVSTVDWVKGAGRTFKCYARHLPFVCRLIAVGLMVVALARPQSSEYGSSTTTEGIDIVLAMDVSASMWARDFTPDRISVAKEMASKFIVDRPNDRIGIVVFAGESFTQSPLTTDKRTLLNLMQGVNIGMIQDGTAIGSGLATSVNRLKESTAESKIVILLTDGVNNSGQISPLTAADIAATYGIKVYTIGVGTKDNMAPYPTYNVWGEIVFSMAKVEIDEEMLRDISKKTGGEYFRAGDKKALSDVYDRINELEKSKIETNDYTRYNELFMGYALAAVCLLVAEFLLRVLWLRRIP